MIDEKATESIEQAVCYELQKIIKEHGVHYHSNHEGYGVILEEVEEAEECLLKLKAKLAFIWQNIKDDNHKILLTLLHELKEYAMALAEEAVQVTAVSERFIDTVKK